MVAKAMKRILLHEEHFQALVRGEVVQALAWSPRPWWSWRRQPSLTPVEIALADIGYPQVLDAVLDAMEAAGHAVHTRNGLPPGP